MTSPHTVNSGDIHDCLRTRLRNTPIQRSALVRGGVPALAPVEGNDTLIPSAVFFDYETKGRVLFGSDAIDTYIEQHDGRLMRALKSILGSPLIDEKTALGSKMVALTEVVEIFVRHLKTKAEAFAGEEITAVVHGRPVRFVENDDAADAKAERVLDRHRQPRRFSRRGIRLRADRGRLPL